MASEDLLKKAFATFNALSPEQQAEMIEAQRQSWVRGNVGLSRDERDMTSPMMSALKTVREENSIGRQAVKAWADSNTRTTPVAPVSPDATGKCGELVRYDLSMFGNGIVEMGGGAYVRFDQAVEILAAKDADIDRVLADNRRCLGRVAEVEADNAALTAKLETANALVTCCCGDPVDAHNIGSDHSPVDQYHYAMMQLEAKLAAAEKALEPFAAVLEDYDPDWEDDDVTAVLVVGSVTHYGITLGDFRKARAVLGGKPS